MLSKRGKPMIMKAIRVLNFKDNAMSDEDLVKRVVAGDKELYELLMRRHNQKLYRVIAGYISNHDDIADTMQDTYLRAYEKLYQFKFNAKFSTWLIRIGINMALARIKSKKHIQLNQMSEEVQKTLLNKMESSRPNPEKKIIQQEAKQILENAIQNLEPKYRVIYILREIENMNMAEIVDCLEITNVNAKVRLHRARVMIKKDLYGLSSTTEMFEFGSKKCDALVEGVMALI